MNMKSMSMYSTQYLVGAPFAWITAAMRRGMESISLWHCSGVMRAQVALIVAFSSSALLGLAYRIFLFTIPHRFFYGVKVRRVCWPIKNRDTIKPGTGSFWHCVQVPSPVGKWNLHLHKVGQQQEAWSALKLPGITAVLTLDLRKRSGPTPADDMAPQPSLTVETLHWTSATWILCLSSLPPDSGTLISKGNAKFTFIREHNFGPLSSSPVLFVL